MKKLTYKHTDAISHAVSFLKPLLRRHSLDPHIADIKNDIRFLKEAREILQHALTHPTLPFPEPDKPPMFNRLIDAVCEVG